MKRFLDFANRLILNINSLLYNLACVMIVCMVLNVVLAVLFNKIANRSFPVPIDFTGFLLLIAVCLSYAGYQYKDGFVRVTMLTDLFPKRLAQATELGVFIVSISFYGFLSSQCFKVAKKMLYSGQKMMSISWKVYPYYFVLAACFLWTMVVTIVQALKYFVIDNEFAITSERIRRREDI